MKPGLKAEIDREIQRMIQAGVIIMDGDIMSFAPDIMQLPEDLKIPACQERMRLWELAQEESN